MRRGVTSCSGWQNQSRGSAQGPRRVSMTLFSSSGCARWLWRWRVRAASLSAGLTMTCGRILKRTWILGSSLLRMPRSWLIASGSSSTSRRISHLIHVATSPWEAHIQMDWTPPTSCHTCLWPRLTSSGWLTLSSTSGSTRARPRGYG